MIQGKGFLLHSLPFQPSNKTFCNNSRTIKNKKIRLVVNIFPSHSKITIPRNFSSHLSIYEIKTFLRPWASQNYAIFPGITISCLQFLNWLRALVDFTSAFEERRRITACRVQYEGQSRLDECPCSFFRRWYQPDTTTIPFFLSPYAEALGLTSYLGDVPTSRSFSTSLGKKGGNFYPLRLFIL